MNEDKELDEMGKDKNGEVSKDVDFEDILDIIGHFGKSQIIIAAILTLTDMPAGMCMLYFIFANANPGVKCLMFEGNMTIENNFTILDDNILCEYNGSKCLQWEFSDSFTSIVTEWDLICEDKYLPKLTVSIQFIGLIIGSMIAAQLADFYGRKRVCLFFNGTMMLTQALVAASNSLPVYAFFRFLVGFFAGGTLGINFVLPMEFVGPTWRPFYGSLGFYGFGHAIMCLAAWLVRDWRYLALVTGLLGTPLILCIALFVPESPRWLIQKRRLEEASEIISKMAKMNGTPEPDMSLLEKIARTDKDNIEEHSRYNYLDLFRTRKLAIRTCVVLFGWFSVSEIYYGVVVQLNNFTGSIFINAVVSALTPLPVQWTTFPLAVRFGRKPTFIIFVTVSCAAMFAIVGLNASGKVDTDRNIVTVLAILGKTTIVGLWTIIGIMTSEIYPTLLRSIGVGAGNTASRLGGMLSPQFALLGLYVHWTLPYIIHGCLALATAIIVFIFIPETNKKHLQEDVPEKRKRRKYVINKPEVKGLRRDTRSSNDDDINDEL